MFQKKTSESGGESQVEKKKPGKIKRLWKRKKVTIIVCVILLLIVGAVAVKSMSGGNTIPTVSVTKAEKQTVAETVSIRGVIEGSETAEITSPMNNKIISINVKEGDKVQKGQVLAVLDRGNLQDAVDQAQNQYESAQYSLDDSLKNAQKEYDAAVRALDDANRTYENNKTLYEAGAISKEEFLKSQTAMENAKSAVDTYNVVNGKVVASGSQQKNVEMQKEALDSKAKDLQDLNIKSPISGTVTRVNARLGRYAADTENKAAMFVVENLDQLQMSVNISQYDISKIKLGQKVLITSDVLGKDQAEGVVSQISPTGEPKTQGSNDMVIPVKITITNDGGGRLIAGVSGTASILIQESKDVLAVSVDALAKDPQTGQDMVYIVDKTNHLKKIPVQLGVESEFAAEVTGGDLKEGDSVVMNPDFSLKEGAEVKAAPEGAVQ